MSEHPAVSLSKIVPEEVKAQYLKTPKLLLIENPVYAARLTALRNNYKYSYIVQWIYLLKHIIKLSDAFDVENLEEELLGIAPPSFINNLKIKLIQHLKNQKLVTIDSEFDFFVDQIYKDYELLLPEGVEDVKKDNVNANSNGDDDDNDDDDDTPILTYSTLTLEQKIEVIYTLIKLSNTKSHANFRKTVDKFEQPHIDLRITPVFQYNEKNLKYEYLILQDARVYLRKWEFKKIEIPSKKTDFDSKFKDPYNDLNQLNPEMIHWECLTAGLYQYDNLIKTLKSSFGKKTSSNEYTLSKILEANVDFVIQHDLKKRKQNAQRKRDIEMQMLMANRKRSSRLEEKERKRKLEEEERLKEFEIIKQQAAQQRAEKRQKLRESRNNGNSNILQSREERLKNRINNGNDDLQIIEAPVEVIDLGNESIQNITSENITSENITLDNITSEPVFESTAEPIALISEPTSEPVSEIVSEPISEQITEPVTTAVSDIIS